MKALIKKLVPTPLLQFYRVKKAQLDKDRKISKFKNKPVNEVFTEIYKSHHWQSNESISGCGSDFEQTKSLIQSLEELFYDKKITSVLDVPCGDFNWMQKVDLSKLNYIGGDIVEELIRKNKERYNESDNLKFQVLDLTRDSLPKSDIIIVRDCLVHLSYSDIFLAIQNIRASGCKYILTTTFTGHRSNHDIITGDWRPLNLQNEPFNFPNPILLINENCTEGNGIYNDKSMALWEVSKI